jgi:thymidylate kinase
MTASIFLEGLPGAGKTELMVALATVLGQRCLAVPETNPTQTELTDLSCISVQERNRWYLKRELDRARLAAALVTRHHPAVAVFDRSYLSVLAYCFAASAVTDDASLYDGACRAFETSVTSSLVSRSVLVVLEIPVNTSLDRRLDKQDREFESDWYREDFLAAMADFYRHRSVEMCRGRLVRMDAAGQSQAAILAALRKLLGTSGVQIPSAAAPTIVRRLAGEIASPSIREYFYANGGLRLFGQPVGDPVLQFAGFTQFFERHALLIDSRMNVSLFDPFDASRILRRADGGR